MTYVIANTYYHGRKWSKSHLFPEEPRQLLHTQNQLRGKLFTHHDCLYVITNDQTILETLFPSVCGSRMFFQTDQFKPKKGS